MKRLILEQWREYNNATNCSVCAKLVKSVDKKVRDHDHLTVEYRGPARNACNLNYRIDPKKVKITCIIYNLKGILFLFSHLLVFETRFDSYFYDFFVSCFDSYFFLWILQILFCSYSVFFLQSKVCKKKYLQSVCIFVGIFCIVAAYVLLCWGYNTHLILSAVKPRLRKITGISNSLKCYTSFTINNITFLDSVIQQLETRKNNSGRP